MTRRAEIVGAGFAGLTAACALAQLDRALALAPGHADALNNRGNSRAAKGDLQSAIADFSEAVDLYPGALKAKAYNNRARALAQKGEPDRALAD